MKIYIVNAHTECEGSDPVKAFYQKKDADNFIISLENLSKEEQTKLTRSYCTDFYTISEIELI